MSTQTSNCRSFKKLSRSLRSEGFNLVIVPFGSCVRAGGRGEAKLRAAARRRCFRGRVSEPRIVLHPWAGRGPRVRASYSNPDPNPNSNLVGSSWLSKRRTMRPFLGPAGPMDPAIVSVTNVGRRKCIALFEDLSYKIEKKLQKTPSFSSEKNRGLPGARFRIPWLAFMVCVVQNRPGGSFSYPLVRFYGFCRSGLPGGSRR